MKSWIHEISESYIKERLTTRKDLKENYVSLNEEQKFELLSENILVYLDEQLQNAYGFGVNDLTEEQLNELLGGLAALAGRAVGGIAKGAKAVGSGITKAAKAVGTKVSDLGKGALNTYAAGEKARGLSKVETAQDVEKSGTVGGKLKAIVGGQGKGISRAFASGMGNTEQKPETNDKLTKAKQTINDVRKGATKGAIVGAAKGLLGGSKEAVVKGAMTGAAKGAVVGAITKKPKC